jgi:predicted small lipoprotein YifL
MNFHNKTLLVYLALLTLSSLSACANNGSINSPSAAAPTKPQTVASAPSSTAKNNQPELEYDP